MTAKEIVAAALGIDPAERASYLATACGGDQDLLSEAQALLRGSPGLGLVPTDPAVTATIASDYYEETASAVIGPYKLIRQLGEGGMGVVYHAQQLQPIRRDVALKIIKPGMDSKQVIARFESERQALALMEHPNIARVFDAGATPTGRPYFVMEMVDGIPITRYCDSQRLTLTQRIELFIPVCQAIQHAHQKGIIHRDIKPSNLLVAEQDGRPVPKVIDFGLAKALGHQLSDATMMTNLGTVVGTLEYMSPEQADQMKHDIDTRSDVYSLGVVLYELLAGSTPLEHERLAQTGYVETLQRIRDEEPAAPSARLRQSTTAADIAERRRTDRARLPKLLHGELDWITMKALEKDRTRRYETVNGLARDLRRYLDGEPVDAGAPPAAYRLRKFVHKHRLWLSAAAAFAALLGAGVVVSSSMAIRASRAEAVARAVNDFLQSDVLAQASANNQARPDTKPDPDLRVRTALDRAAAGIKGKFATQPLVEASIRQTVGNTYKDLGLFPEAQGQVERAIEVRRRVLGEEHPDTLGSISVLTEILYQQGKYAQMEALSAKLLEARRRVLGDKHPDTALTLNNLGVAYMMQGKFAQADTLYSKALEVQRRVLGEEHKETLNTMSNLASVYLRQGNYAQAETFFSKVLEVRRRVEGEEHPDTLIGMNNLALTYSREGKYTQAEPLYANVVGVQRRVLGEEHPDTLFSMNNVAQQYRGQGKYAEEEPLRAKVMEGMRRALGEEHPVTLGVMSSLAALYTIQNKPAQAQSLLDKVLEVRRRVLGEEQADTLDALAALGRVRLLQERFPEAEAMLREALKSNEKTRPAAWQRYYSQSLLGASLAGQRKFTDAEPLLLAAYEGLVQRESKMSAVDRAAIREAGNRIAQLYVSWGKTDKTAEWAQKLQAAKIVSRSQ